MGDVVGCGVDIDARRVVWSVNRRVVARLKLPGLAWCFVTCWGDKEVLSCLFEGGIDRVGWWVMG